jgi:hypothetical protein
MPTLAERIFKALLRACSETVERDGKTCNAYFRHSELPFISAIYLIASNVSDLGHSLPRLPALAPPDVRYASISDQNFAAP